MCSQRNSNIMKTKRSVILHFWQNGERSPAAISRMTKISIRTINYNIKKIKQQGTIEDHHTTCNIPDSDWYDKYEPNKIKLCNGICYDSAIQRCINGILIDCTPSWSFERCKYEAIDCLQYGNTTLLSTLTPPTTKLTSSSLSSSSEIPTTTPSYASSIYIQFSCLHISLIVVVQMLNTNFLF